MTASPPDPDIAGHLSRRRLFAVLGVTGIVVLGSLVAILLRKEFWPFSPYPMYQNIAAQDSIQIPKVYAVVDGGEVALDNDYFGPFFSVQGFVTALRDLDPEQKQLAVMEWLQLHPSVPGQSSLRLDGLKIYSERFVVEDYARNRSQPSDRELQFELLLKREL